MFDIEIQCVNIFDKRILKIWIKIIYEIIIFKKFSSLDNITFLIEDLYCNKDLIKEIPKF